MQAGRLSDKNTDRQKYSQGGRQIYSRGGREEVGRKSKIQVDKNTVRKKYIDKQVEKIQE